MIVHCADRGPTGREPLFIVSSRDELAGLKDLGQGPALELATAAETEPDQVRGRDLALVHSLRSESRWLAEMDEEFPERMHKWGAASVRRLYLGALGLPADPAGWTAAGLGRERVFAELNQAGPYVPASRRDYFNPHDPADTGPEPPRRIADFDPKLHLAAQYLGREHPQPDYLLADSLSRPQFGLLAAPGGTGKGFLALQLGAALAAGRQALGLWDVPRPRRVFYLSGEESQATVERRTAGALMSLGLDPNERKEAGGRFWSLSADGSGPLAEPDGRGGLALGPAWEHLETALNQVRPEIVFLDHFARFLPVNENDNAMVTRACALLSELAARHRCALVALHHTSKPMGQGLLSASGEALARALDPAAVRGGTALMASARWILLLSPLAADLAVKKLGEQAKDRRPGLFAAGRVAKKNEGPAEDVFYLKHEAGGFFRPVRPAEGDDHELADAKALAAEVARRETAGEKPLSKTRGGLTAFGWGVKRCQRASEKAIDLGLLDCAKRVGGKGAVLQIPQSPAKPKGEGNLCFANDIQMI